LVRERQDLLVAWQEKDRTLIAARALSPEKRDVKTEAALAEAIAGLDRRLDSVDQGLASSLAGYDVLARPQALKVENIQALLGPDEALLLFFDVSGRTYIWAINRTDFRWTQSSLGTPSLKREVAALRCGLDMAAWYDGSRFFPADVAAKQNTNLG